MIEIKYSDIITIVVSGCILGTMGVIGTQVYKGAVTDKHVRTVTDAVIMEQIADLSIRIDDYMANIDNILEPLDSAVLSEPAGEAFDDDILFIEELQETPPPVQQTLKPNIRVFQMEQMIQQRLER